MPDAGSPVRCSEAARVRRRSEPAPDHRAVFRRRHRPKLPAGQPSRPGRRDRKRDAAGLGVEGAKHPLSIPPAKPPLRQRSRLERSPAFAWPRPIGQALPTTTGRGRRSSRASLRRDRRSAWSAFPPLRRRSPRPPGRDSARPSSRGRAPSQPSIARLSATDAPVHGPEKRIGNGLRRTALKSGLRKGGANAVPNGCRFWAIPQLAGCPENAPEPAETTSEPSMEERRLRTTRNALLTGPAPLSRTVGS